MWMRVSFVLYSFFVLFTYFIYSSRRDCHLVRSVLTSLSAPEANRLPDEAKRERESGTGEERVGKV